MKKIKILGLHDNKTGHKNQLLGVLSILSKDKNFEVLEDSIKKFSLDFLPNSFHKLGIFYPMNIKKKIKEKALKDNLPDIIIAIGRKSFATLWQYKKIAKRYHKNLKIICLMPPIKDADKYFDLVFFHQYKNNIPSKRLFPIISAPHNLDEEKLQKARKINNFISEDSKKPIISILIGGKAKGINLSKKGITELVELIKKIQIETKGSLFISTSRRTGQKNEDLLKEKLQGIANFYGFYENNQGENNPFLEMLSKSDYVVVTGESISMISESCFVRSVKAVYIFTSKHFFAKRYCRFHQFLYDNNYAFEVKDFDSLKKSNHFDVKSDIVKEIYNIIK